MSLLNRRADLKGLVRWAKRKGHTGPQIAYEQKLDRTIRTFLAYKEHYPRLVRWARFLHWVNRVLNPPPRYYAKGSARKYRKSAA